MLRLGYDEKLYTKLFSFKVVSNGFDFQKFENLKSLHIFGNISQQNNGILRLEPFNPEKQPSKKINKLYIKNYFQA